MPTILCDVSRLFYRRLNGRLPTGIDRVSLEYLRHYAARARAVLGIGPFFSALSSAESGRAFRALLGAPARDVGEMSALMLRAYLRWWTRPAVAGSILLNTSHTGLERTGYASSIRRRGALPVFFVHDLIPITHPQYCRRGERDRHVARMRTVLTAARGIITPSRHTLDTLERYGREMGAPLPPAVVAPLASSLPRLEPGPRPLRQPYFVVVGTIEPRKNLLLLFNLWRVIIEREGDAAPRLVVVGQRGWDCAQEAQLLESPALRAHVSEVGACSDAELVTWLAHAQALLFPSFEEGYGLPLAEALSLGVPVIASELPVFREIAGDIPEYAAPTDRERWTALVQAYTAPCSPARNAQLDRLRRFRPTSWPGHFGIVDQFLERVSAGRARSSEARTTGDDPLLRLARALGLEAHEVPAPGAADIENPVHAQLAAVLRTAAERRLAEIARAGTTREQALDALRRALAADPEEPAPAAAGDEATQLAAAQLALKGRDLDGAARLFRRLLAAGHLRGPVVAGIAEVARQRFDFATAARTLAVYNLFDPQWQGGQGHFLQGRAELLAGNAAAGVEALAVACRLNPRQAETIASAFAITQALTRAFGKLPYAGAFFAAAAGENSGPVARAWALIASRRTAEAERALLAHAPTPDEAARHGLALSSAYSAQGKLEEAKRLLEPLLPRHPSAPLYAEALRIAVLGSDHAWGGELLAAAQSRRIEVPEEYRRKVRLAAGDIRGGFDSFRYNAWAEILKPYCGSSFVRSLEDAAARGGTLAILAFGGPGDEVRFASFYPEIRRRCAAQRVIFTCEPRLAPLLRRSFPGLEFLPVQRGLNGLARHADLREFTRLPGFDLHALLDNAGWELVRGAGSVMLVSDAIADVVEGYGSFSGKPHLVADTGQAERWRARLAQRAEGPLVGLSWRGSLANYVRNEHYYAVGELAPLFEETGIRYVNLQYDDCAEELAWLESRYPGRVIDFPDLDQHDDLDGVAALMSCLDLVIAPPTTVADLAGALGRPTWMLANSAEHLWRRKPGAKTDMWLHSLVHIAAGSPGNKKAVLASLVTDLRRKVHPAGEE